MSIQISEVVFRGCGHRGFSVLPAPAFCRKHRAEELDKQVDALAEEIVTWFVQIDDPKRRDHVQAVTELLYAYGEWWKPIL